MMYWNIENWQIIHPDHGDPPSGLIVELCFSKNSHATNKWQTLFERATYRQRRGIEHDLFFVTYDDVLRMSTVKLKNRYPPLVGEAGFHWLVDIDDDVRKDIICDRRWLEKKPDSISCTASELLTFMSRWKLQIKLLSPIIVVSTSYYLMMLDLVHSCTRHCICTGFPCIKSSSYDQNCKKNYKNPNIGISCFLVSY